MLIRYMSDLHTEFSSVTIPNLSTDKETVLVLAGDIGVVDKPSSIVEFMMNHSLSFKAVVYVLGNHEYYHGNLTHVPQKLKELMMPFENVHVLNNDTIVVDNVAFVGTTLWTNYDNHNEVVKYQALLDINDFKYIRHGPRHTPWQRKLKTSDIIQQNIENRIFILHEVGKHKQLGRKVVVITHHAPSFQSIPEYFKGDRLSGAYACELGYDFLELEDIGANPNLVVHGHTHAQSDYMIGKTRIVCNPRGYVTSTEDQTPITQFNPNKVIEL